MTTFDPAFAREVLERRRDDKNRQASQLLLDKYAMIYDGEIDYLGPRAHRIDQRVHELWREADSYDSILAYLDGRIWDEKTRAEKIWETMHDWDNAWGPRMVDDVFEAAAEVDKRDQGI